MVCDVETLIYKRDILGVKQKKKSLELSQDDTFSTSVGRYFLPVQDSREHEEVANR